MRRLVRAAVVSVFLLSQCTEPCAAQADPGGSTATPVSPVDPVAPVDQNPVDQNPVDRNPVDQNPADKNSATALGLQGAASPEVLKWQTQAREILAIVGDDKIPLVKRSKLYSDLMAIPPSAKEDPRFQLAFALFALNQKKNADALKITEQIVSVSDHDASARAMQARLLLLSFKTSQTIVEIESLIEALRDPAPTSSPAQLEHAARFLGLVIGYFSGPGRELIRPTALAELVVAAQDLPDNLRTAYESAKLTIEEEYRVLTEEGEEALKALREGLEKEASAMRERLESERAKAANDSEYARMELQTSFTQLNNQWQTAWNSSQLLGQQGSDLIRRQAQLQASIGAVLPPRRDSQGNIDLNDQLRYQNDLNFFQNAISSLDYQIAGVARQYNRVCAQGMIAERQMAGLQARAQQFGMQLAMQNQSFNQLDNAIRQKEQAATQAEPKKKTKEQLRRERSFLTYDDFNIHKEKKLLLDSIALVK